MSYRRCLPCEEDGGWLISSTRYSDRGRGGFRPSQMRRVRGDYALIIGGVVKRKICSLPYLIDCSVIIGVQVQYVHKC